MVIQVLTCVSLAVFVMFSLARVVRFVSMPIHVRWELYPVPHEGKAHGGSYFEQVDWWTKARPHDQIGTMWFMAQEIALLKALYHENRSLWTMSFPFHLGLYFYGVWVVLVVFGAVLGLAGVPVETSAGGLGGVLGLGTAAAGLAAFGVGTLGTLGMMYKRFTDPNLVGFTTFKEHFNLGLLLALFVTGLLAWVTEGSFGPFGLYLGSLVTFGGLDGVGVATLAHVVVLAVFMMYFPFTHMTHAFTKWFMWHDVRWADDPNLRGSKVEARVRKALAYPVSWNAPHIAGRGRTWAELATTLPGSDED